MNNKLLTITKEHEQAVQQAIIKLFCCSILTLTISGFAGSKLLEQKGNNLTLMCLTAFSFSFVVSSLPHLGSLLSLRQALKEEITSLETSNSCPPSFDKGLKISIDNYEFSQYLEPIENIPGFCNETGFSKETALICNEAVAFANLVTEIRDWLISQNIYRCIIQIDGQPYQLDALFGITTPPENTRHLTVLDFPLADKI